MEGNGKGLVIASVIFSIGIISASYLIAGPSNAPSSGPQSEPDPIDPKDWIWRAQITTITGEVDKSRTDDGVRVKFSDQYGWKTAWLNHRGDDREGGQLYTYDIPIREIPFLISQIGSFQISKTGDNGWCLKQFVIRINERAIYDKSFEDVGPGCLWLDNDNDHQRSFTVNADELRAKERYDEFGITVPSSYTDTTHIQKIIEAVTANFMRGTNLFWSDKFSENLEIDQLDSDTYRVKIHLREDDSFGRDEVRNVNFDLNFYCGVSDGRTHASASNVNDLDDIVRTLPGEVSGEFRNSFFKKDQSWDALSNWDCVNTEIVSDGRQLNIDIQPNPDRVE